jgi:hypothetical protein
MKSTIAAFAMALGIVISGASPAEAQLTPDDGKCTAGFFQAYTGHEFSHDLAAAAVGDHPLRPGALWGDKWTDTQRHFKHIALGGLIGQLWTAAVATSSSYDTQSRCAVHGNTLISVYYAIRAKRLSDDPGNYAAHAGDYAAFSVDERRKITATTMGAAFFLEMTSDSIAADEEWHREHSSFFDFNSIPGAP